MNCSGPDQVRALLLAKRQRDLREPLGSLNGSSVGGEETSAPSDGHHVSSASWERDST